MEPLKQALGKLLFPPVAALVLLTGASAALLAYGCLGQAPAEPAVYGGYALSAYTLAALCARAPALVRWVRRLRRENPYLHRYSADPVWRVKLSLGASLAGNGLYAAFQLGLGIWHQALWYYVLASYYALLLVMRLPLARRISRGGLGRDIPGEYRLYRRCGVVLAVMNVALATMVFYMAHQGRGFSHHSITAIAIAAYTFFSLTMALINVVRYRRYCSPLLSAAKAVSLAAALVSMLTLETAMLNAFGSAEEAAFRRSMTASSGGMICLLILGMGLFMIAKANRALGRNKQGDISNGR